MKTRFLFVLSLFVLFITELNAQNNQLYPYLGKKRYGYVDDKFLPAIAEQFTYAEPFSNGLAIVSDRNGSGIYPPYVGLINSTGKWILPSDYDQIEPFYEGYSVVKKGRYLGLIDTTGGLILPLRYEDIMRYGSGLIGVKEGYYWGYADPFGNIKIPYQFDKITPFEGNRAMVKQHNSWIMIDKSGRQIFNGEWDLSDGFSEGLASVRFFGGDFGFIDSTGRNIIPTRFENVRLFHEGRAAIRKDGFWGFIDKNGNQISKPVYYEVQDFSEGLAAVDYKGKWGYIDITGRVVVSAIYNDVEPFKNGLARVKDNHNTYYYIDKTGKVVYSYQ